VIAWIKRWLRQRYATPCPGCRALVYDRELQPVDQAIPSTVGFARLTRYHCCPHCLTILYEEELYLIP
jgi:hypothetical protein